MVRDGIHYAGALTLLGGLAAYGAGPLWGLPAWMLAAFVLYFFRDPERTVPPGEVLVSPADGRIVDLRQVERDGQRHWKVSIFLSILDVHVNRAPVGGVIRQVEYQRGRFHVASRPEASAENEQNTVTIEASPFSVTFKQIAGLVARRIVFYKKPGDPVACGERVGLIKFGSRVDVFWPGGLPPLVTLGQRVQAGSSMLTRWTAGPVSSAARSESLPAMSPRVEPAKH